MLSKLAATFSLIMLKIISLHKNGKDPIYLCQILSSKYTEPRQQFCPTLPRAIKGFLESITAAELMEISARRHIYDGKL